MTPAAAQRQSASCRRAGFVAGPQVCLALCCYSASPLEHALLSDSPAGQVCGLKLTRLPVHLQGGFQNYPGLPGRRFLDDDKVLK